MSRGGELQLVLSGVNSNTANVARGYASSIVARLGHLHPDLHPRQRSRVHLYLMQRYLFHLLHFQAYKIVFLNHFSG
mgnify:CR=1 FL=1